jgi:hypothetical protein
MKSIIQCNYFINKIKLYYRRKRSDASSNTNSPRLEKEVMVFPKNYYNEPPSSNNERGNKELNR